MTIEEINKLKKMDNHTANDNNNPINWNGKEPAICERCHNILTPEEYKNQQKNCFECIEEIEERKELEKQFLKFPELEEDEKLKINLKAQRETLNKIFDSFSIATIGSFDKDGNLI